LTVVLLLNRPSGESIGSVGAVVYAAGDLAGEGDGDIAVTTMLSRHNFDALLTLGDHAYENGSVEEFADEYASTYGEYDDRVRPAPGSHDYVTPDAAGYFDYFERNSPTFAGDPYYAFALGGWRIYSLNSEIGQGQPGTEMYEWLRDDLNEHPADCVLAYWHKPMFTVGRKDNDEGGMSLIWGLLAAHGADIVLAAHDHNYQRWAPIDGITSFVIGTGGRSRYPISRVDERLAASDDGHYGALELALRPEGASYAFRSADDRVIDSGDVSCSGPVVVQPRPQAPTGLHTERDENGVERLTWVAPGDTTGIIGYVVIRAGNVIGYSATTSFADASKPEATSVLYSVRAVSAFGLPSSASAPAASGGAAIGFSGGVWSAPDQNPSSPTRDKPQSKLWFADETWWGILYTAEPDDRAAAGYYIHRFDADAQAWTNTGVAVDERDRSHADALWDDAAQRLYVVSSIESGAIKLYRYDYAEGGYTPDPDFPIRLTENGSESATIAKDSLGTLWVTITQKPDGSGACVTDEPCVVQVMHSTSADDRWTTPFDVPVDGPDVAADDISSVVAFDERIGIAWSDQLEGSFRFASHSDGDPDSAWTVESLVVAPRFSDDHINLKADEAGNVYLVGKTSLNDPADAPSDAPLVVVWVRQTDGLWRRGVAWTVADDVTRPQLVVDPTLGRVAVVAAAPGSGGAIYAKSAETSSLAFEPGIGTPLIVSSLVNNPTTTKQPVDMASGVLVLAGDRDSHTYWHNMVTGTP
jgi:hypothetical protein